MFHEMEHDKRVPAYPILSGLFRLILQVIRNEFCFLSHILEKPVKAVEAS